MVLARSELPGQFQYVPETLKSQSVPHLPGAPSAREC